MFQAVKIRAIALLTLLFILAACCNQGFAQATISTGAIVGTITDPTGGVVPNAKITIANKGTG